MKTNTIIITIISILLIAGTIYYTTQTTETPDQTKTPTTPQDTSTPPPNETETTTTPDSTNQTDTTTDTETKEPTTTEYTVPIHPGMHQIPGENQLKTDIKAPDNTNITTYTYDDPDILTWYTTQLSDLNYIAQGTDGDKDVELNWIQYETGETRLIILTLTSPGMPAPILGIIQGTRETLKEYTPTLPIRDEEKEPHPINDMFPGDLPLPENPILYNTSPINPEDIKEIWPLGTLGPESGHTFPTTNGYLVWKNPEAYPPSIEVVSPADGYIIEISYEEKEWQTERTGTYSDYEIRIATAKTQITRIGHISELSEELQTKIGPLETGMNQMEIPVTEGELLGYTGGRPGAQYTMNWRIHDKSIKSFINPEKYGLSSTEAHFLDYCTPELYEQLIPLMTRTTEPIVGTYDYDVNGTLSGNWFHNETSKNDPLTDWTKHLSFCYDPYDNTRPLISVGGTLNTEIGVYYVENENPKFTETNKNTGPITYWTKGDPTDERYRNIPKTTFLVELQDNNILHIETFNGWIDHPEFTENAQTYTR